MHFHSKWNNLQNDSLFQTLVIIGIQKSINHSVWFTDKFQIIYKNGLTIWFFVGRLFSIDLFLVDNLFGFCYRHLAGLCIIVNDYLNWKKNSKYVDLVELLICCQTRLTSCLLYCLISLISQYFTVLIYKKKEKRNIQIRMQN